MGSVAGIERSRPKVITKMGLDLLATMHMRKNSLIADWTNGAQAWMCNRTLMAIACLKFEELVQVPKIAPNPYIGIRPTVFIAPTIINHSHFCILMGVHG